MMSPRSFDVQTLLSEYNLKHYELRYRKGLTIIVSSLCDDTIFVILRCKRRCFRWDHEWFEFYHLLQASRTRIHVWKENLIFWSFHIKINVFFGVISKISLLSMIINFSSLRNIIISDHQLLFSVVWHVSLMIKLITVIFTIVKLEY